jgi:hypothetical protein
MAVTIKAELTLSEEELVERLRALSKAVGCDAPDGCEEDAETICVNCSRTYCFNHSGCTRCVKK